MHVTERFRAPMELKFIGDGTDQPGSFEGYGSVFNRMDLNGDIVRPGAFAESLAEYKAAGTMPGLYAEHSFAMFGGDPLPIGVWDEMGEDETGLFGKGRLLALDTDHGKRLYGLMRERVLKSMSIAFHTKAFTPGEKPGEPKRWLDKVELYSVDLVTNPANTAAQVTALKSVLAHADHTGALAAVRNAINLHRQTMSGGDAPTAGERQQMMDHLQAAHRCLAGSEAKAAPPPDTIREFEAFLHHFGGFSIRAARAIGAGGFKSAATPRDGAAAVTEAIAGVQEALAGLRGLRLTR